MKSIQATTSVCLYLKLLRKVTLQSLGLLVCLNSCVETGRKCENDADYIAFEAQVDEFVARSSRSRCFELQEAARELLSNSEGCSDKVIVEATASPWLVLNCNNFTSFVD